MRKSSIIGAGIVAAALVVAPEAASAGGWWHNREAVEVRIGPGIAYARLVLVPKHQRLHVYHCAGWCDVSWGNYHGYVHTKYIVNDHADHYIVNGYTNHGYVGPGHHLSYVTPRFADHLFVSPVTRHGRTYLTPIYASPQPAYLTSQVISPSRGYDAGPVGRIWYFQGRWLDRPDYFYDIRH